MNVMPTQLTNILQVPTIFVVINSAKYHTDFHVRYISSSCLDSVKDCSSFSEAYKVISGYTNSTSINIIQFIVLAILEYICRTREMVQKLV